MNTRTRTKEKYMSSRGDAHAGLCNHDDCLDQCCQTAQGLMVCDDPEASTI